MGIEDTPFDRRGSARRRLYEQFEDKNTERNRNGIRVIDASPEKIRDPIPVLFAPSWALGIKANVPIFEALNESGRRAISIDHPRTGGYIARTDLLLKYTDKAEQNTSRKLLETYPKEGLRRAITILNALKEKSIEQTDAIAYSAGAIDIIAAALLEPGRFRNIVLYAPAGLIGKDTLTRLGAAFLTQSERLADQPGIPVSEEERAEAKAVGNTIAAYEPIPVSEGRQYSSDVAPTETVKYVLKNPVRAFNEIRGVSESQIHEALHILREKGILISVIAAVDDPVFPISRMLNVIREDMVDGFMTIRSPGHGMGPPEIYIPAIESALRALERKREIHKDTSNDI